MICPNDLLLTPIVSPSESIDPPKKEQNFADVHRETYAQN